MQTPLVADPLSPFSSSQSCREGEDRILCSTCSLGRCPGCRRPRRAQGAPRGQRGPAVVWALAAAWLFLSRKRCQQCDCGDFRDVNAGWFSCHSVSVTTVSSRTMSVPCHQLELSLAALA